MPEPPVVLAGARRTFPGRGASGPSINAVDGVDLEVKVGESVGLVGRSGAGKSTLARMIVGIERPDAGRVHLFGVDLWAGDAQRRSAVLGRVGMVFQDPYAALSPNARVLDIVLEPLRIHHVAGSVGRTRAIDALADVGLDGRGIRDRYPAELSGGERQRVALARAMAMQPDLLVADEPTSMLDASRQTRFLALIAELRGRRPLTFVYITHDLALAAAACDRLVVMDAGSVVDAGPTAEVIARPSAMATMALIAASRARAAVRDRARSGAGHAGQAGHDGTGHLGPVTPRHVLRDVPRDAP